MFVVAAEKSLAQMGLMTPLDPKLSTHCLMRTAGAAYSGVRGAAVACTHEWSTTGASSSPAPGLSWEKTRYSELPPLSATGPASAAPRKSSGFAFNPSTKLVITPTVGHRWP